MKLAQTSFEKQLELALYALEYNFGKVRYLGNILKDGIPIPGVGKEDNTFGSHLESVCGKFRDGKKGYYVAPVRIRIGAKSKAPIRVVYNVLIDVTLFTFLNEKLEKMIKKEFANGRACEIAKVQVFEDNYWKCVRQIEATPNRRYLTWGCFAYGQTRTYNEKEMTSIIANELMRRDKLLEARV